MTRCQGDHPSRDRAFRTSGMLTALLLLIAYVASPAFAQEHLVSGTVIDAETDGPLPGANIVVKGTTLGATSDSDGQYEVEAPSAQDTLVFSFVGYETQEIPIQGRSEIDVTMVTGTLLGEELVVVGYGVQRRRDVTGAVSSVTPEELTKIPTQSLGDALQGKVAGVQITPPGGRPGAQPTVRIRGVGTLNNADPLYVVDGMLLDDISFLDTRNVESVDVLKDASATAIYGSRGANGVVLITTKQGTTRGTQVSFNSYYGAQNVSSEIGLVNARDFAMLVNESAANEGKAPVFDNPEQFDEGFDWQGWLFRDGAPQQSHNIAVRGGTEDMLFNVSGSYFNQNGIIRKSEYERLTLRVNNQYFLSDRIDIGHNLNFSYEDFTDETRGRNVVGLVNYTLQAPPTLTPTDDNGDFTDVSIHGGRFNPAAQSAFSHNDNDRFRTTGNLYLNVDVLPGLTFRSTFGLDWVRRDNKDFVPEFFVTALQRNEDSRLTVWRGSSSNWLNENTLTYRRDFGDHSLDAVGGITAQEFQEENVGATRLNIPADPLNPQPDLLYLSIGETEGQTNFSGANAWGMLSFLGRVNYGFKDRYLLTATFRRDGSSRFARRHRWGNFPSIAAGWVVSNEPFMQNVPGVDFMKLRASWGRIGNDKIATSAAIPTVRSNVNAVFGENQDIHSGAVLNSLGNPDLRWEETEQVDVGLELGFFDRRLNATIDYYNRETNDILIAVPIPNIVGVPVEPIVNAASVLNRGLEFDLGWRSRAGDFIYDISANLTTVHNEVLSLGGGRDEIRAAGVRNIGQTTITIPGEAIGSFFGWKQAGIFQSQEEIDSSPNRGEERPGDIRIEDVNGDGQIDDDDRTILGSPIPDFYYGASLDLGYKGIDFSMDFDGQAGNKVLYARTAERGFGVFNYEEEFLNRWTGPGTSETEPRITDGGHNYSVLDRFLYDGSFLRVRNITLGYSLPRNLVNRLQAQRLRLYVSATNPVTVTDYIGYNPQVGGGPVIATGIDNGTYPIASTYTFGAQLDF